MRASRNLLLMSALSGAGCLGRWVAPASPASLACSLHELGRLGYLISARTDGSAWQQAYRGRAGGGEEIWIRLVDDGGRAAWLDARVTGWDQFPQRPQLDGDTSPFVFREWGGQGQEDVRTIRDACEPSRSRNAVAGQP